jgi:hypothetical protein
MTKFASPTKSLNGRPSKAKRPLIEKVREICDIDRDVYSFALNFKTEAGNRKTAIVARSLINYPRKVQEILLDKGAHLDLSGQSGLQAITDVLSSEPRLPAIFETSYTGWHGKSFVSQQGVVGPLKGKLRLREAGSTKLGTIDKWKAGLWKPCDHSDFLVLALAIPFATPLLKVASFNDGAIFYLWGKSSSGKTLAQRALVSVGGRAEENDLFTFEHSGRDLEEECGAFNDIGMVLNESERLQDDEKMRAKIFKSLAYTVAGGVGFTRSRVAVRNFDLRNEKWRIFCLGSGETSAKRVGRLGGEEIRMVDIPVRPPEEGGIFNCAGPTAELMADLVEKTIEKNYGVALMPYIEGVCADLDATRERVEGRVALFVKNVAPNADPRVKRLVRKFGLIYAGALEAVQHGVAPCSKLRAQVAITKLCRVALSQIDAPDYSVENALATLVRTVSDASHFPVVEEGARLPNNGAIGFRRTLTEGQAVCISPENLRRLVAGADSLGALLGRLASGGVLLTDRDGKRARKVQVGPGDRRRYYCLEYKGLLRIADADRVKTGMRDAA